MDTTIESFISWGRYVHWAHVAYEAMSSVSSDTIDQTNARSESLMLAHSARWVGSLYSVLEGWRKLGFTDPTIDALIKGYDEYCAALRRYRNAVFHFQEEMYDQRMTAFTTRYSESMLWAAALHFEFERYLWQWPDKFRGTSEERDELRSILNNSIGWLPTDIIAARMHELQRLAREAQRELEHRDDRSSQEALELQQAIDQIRDLINSTDPSPLVTEFLNLTSPKK